MITKALKLKEGVLLSLVIIVIFLIFAFIFTHFDKVFEYDTDEGLCLMRGYLHAHGYSLYSDIWMDTTPVLVLLLSGLFKVFGPSVFIARILILIFSSLILWGLFQIITKTQNLLSAFLAVFLLILSPYYLRLSVSVIVGLPAVALAVLSCYALLLYQGSYKKSYLLLSGLLIGLALETKFFVVAFLPGMIIEMILIERNRQTKERFVDRSVNTLLWWFFALVSVLGFISFAARIDYSQIIEPYLLGRKLSNGTLGLPSTLEWLMEEYDIVLLIIAVSVFLKKKDRVFFFMPLLTFISGIFIFVNHAPIWHHHRILVTIPMYWLASFGFYKLFSLKPWQAWRAESKIRNPKEVLAFFILGFIFILVMVRLPLRYQRMAKETEGDFPREYRYVIDLMRQYRRQVDLVVTDRPIFAFYAGLPVYPYLTISSWKRLSAGLLTAKDFANIIEKDKPWLVLFARFPQIHRDCMPYLAGRYYLAYRGITHPVWLYRLKEG